jgi:prephenate dehydrogenase
MSALREDRIGIVGLGAIGGSLALALRDHARVIAWSRDAADRDGARATGLSVCRDHSTWAEEMDGSTAIIVAVPLDELASVVRHLTTVVPDECVLLHASSLQRPDALGLSDAEFVRVLGAHPLAGSEGSGFTAANRDMFRDATIRAEARASVAHRALIERMWRAAGATRIVWDAAESHDALMAWVSHLPQLTATALASILAQRGVAFGDVGPGGREMTRLAASDLALWAPILERAPRETGEALRRLTSELDVLREALEAHDARSLRHGWTQARVWKQGEGESA